LQKKFIALFHIIISTLIQGITEFLPISSTHLIIFHKIAGQASAENNLFLDIGVHVGTLFAVLIYFWRDIAAMLTGLIHLITGKLDHAGARLAMMIIISSIPVILAGLALHMINPLWLRETWILATTTLIFGGLLWFVDDFKAQDRALETLTIKDALFIGLAQTIALIPGTSRSGITMTAGRGLGFSRTDSARYSLLLSIIAISGAGMLGGKDLLEVDNIALTTDIAIASALSFVTALIAIAVMMKWLTTQSFKIFAIYRIILGLSLFAALGLGIIS
jgi:undecaprenyl-diphosphatase